MRRDLPYLTLPRLPQGLAFDVPKVHGGRFDVRAAGDGATIEIFDAIGEWGIDVSQVAHAVRELSGRPITVAINSPGGDLFAGTAIYNLLRAHDAPVTVQVLGHAASAASIIAMAGDRIEMAHATQMMIHRCWLAAIGNVDVMRSAIGLMDKADGQMARVYAARSGQSLDAITEMMAATTWLTAPEAVEKGLADVELDRNGLPPLERVDARAPQSLRELEARMRRDLDLSKSTARRAASATWAAIHNDDESNTPRLARVAEALRRSTFDL